MRFCILGSGSRGNSLVVWTDKASILIDAGLSYKQTLERMKARDIDPWRIQALFLTHEHRDHLQGVHRWLEKHASPVYATQPTIERAGISRLLGVCPIGARGKAEVGNLLVEAVPTIHNAAQPVTFVVRERNGSSLAMVFETGRVTDELARAAAGAEFLLLEANHDRQML